MVLSAKLPVLVAWPLSWDILPDGLALWQVHTNSAIAVCRNRTSHFRLVYFVICLAVLWKLVDGSQLFDNHDSYIFQTLLSYFS
jgi:hypothetical protein